MLLLGGISPSSVASLAATVANIDVTAPSGYSVAFTTDPIANANKTAAAIQISNAEVGTTYSYSISSSGGGTPVTGNGTISTETQSVTGINVSALGDGTLTVSLTLTDDSGNTGGAVGDTVSKDTTAPSGYSVAFTTDPIDANNQTAAALQISSAEVGSTYSYSITSSGGGSAVTGSGTVSGTTQNVTGINVSGLGDGTLTVSVTLTDAAENTGSVATDTVAKNTATLPANSLSFTHASSKYLRMPNSSFGGSLTRSKMAISCWVKRSATGIRGIFGQAGYSGDRCFRAFFDNAGRLNIECSTTGTTYDGALITNATYTSTSSWYHILIHFDMLNATPGNRMLLWVNGSEETSFLSDSAPAQSAIATPNNAFSSDFMMIGNGSYPDGYYFDGLIYQFALFSNSLPAIGDVYNGGSPKDVSGITGLYSLLDGESAVSDAVLVTDWTNNGTVTTSSTIPT